MTNRSAFLTTIAISELGQALIDISDRGYNILVGSTPAHVMLFHDYSTHPHILNSNFNSTAAGRYQIIYPTFKGLCENNGYTDFSPLTQDDMALSLITARGALEDVDHGNFEAAVLKCSPEWASFPGGDSGQPENKMTVLKRYFVQSGGMPND